MCIFLSFPTLSGSLILWFLDGGETVPSLGPGSWSSPGLRIGGRMLSLAREGRQRGGE